MEEIERGLAGTYEQEKLLEEKDEEIEEKRRQLNQETTDHGQEVLRFQLKVQDDQMGHSRRLRRLEVMKRVRRKKKEGKNHTDCVWPGYSVNAKMMPTVIVHIITCTHDVAAYRLNLYSVSFESCDAYPSAFIAPAYN